MCFGSAFRGPYGFGLPQCTDACAAPLAVQRSATGSWLRKRGVSSKLEMPPSQRALFAEMFAVRTRIRVVLTCRVVRGNACQCLRDRLGIGRFAYVAGVGCGLERYDFFVRNARGLRQARHAQRSGCHAQHDKRPRRRCVRHSPPPENPPSPSPKPTPTPAPTHRTLKRARAQTQRYSRTTALTCDFGARIARFCRRPQAPQARSTSMSSSRSSRRRAARTRRAGRRRSRCSRTPCRCTSSSSSSAGSG